MKKDLANATFAHLEHEERLLILASNRPGKRKLRRNPKLTFWRLEGIFNACLEEAAQQK